MHQLEEIQERLTRERRWKPRRITRSHGGSQEEEKDWRVHNFEERRHQHQPPKTFFHFLKLPSFDGDSFPNVYLEFEVKVEQIFNMYEVKEDQKVKLASLEFLDYAMQW